MAATSPAPIIGLSIGLPAAAIGRRTPAKRGPRNLVSTSSTMLIWRTVAMRDTATVGDLVLINNARGAVDGTNADANATHARNDRI